MPEHTGPEDEDFAADSERGPEWRRRHAETESEPGDVVVNAEPPAEDWAARHGRCS